MYEKYNTSVSRQLVEYFSNIENREEILQNFARFTLYVKDLTVQMTEEQPGYTELDLLSDIGKNKIKGPQCTACLTIYKGSLQ